PVAMSKRRVADSDEDLAKLAVKHGNLKQDYNELQRETRALKKRMQRATLKKDNLLAEVRFLRRRHKFLTKNSSHASQKQSSDASPLKQSLAPSQGTGTLKHTKYDYEVHPKQPLPAQQMAAKYEYANRGTFFEESIAPQPLKNKHFTMVNSIHSSVNNPPAAREFQVFWEPLREEAPAYVETPVRMPLLENGGLASDLNLSIFKDIPNGFVLPNKTGKRNISWQDQMVLGV
ncbi:hypothetical protein KI387_030934, partial [Taxus chinensis]